jgi:4-hydroxy-3-methylbut-2-en-1-yl diphosphate synthase IspG/GcpE
VRISKQTAMTVTLAVAAAGCVRYGAGEAAEGALGGVLDEMAEEERREQLAEVAASPEMQEAVEDLTRAAARAAVAGMAEELDAVLTEDFDE